MACEFAHIPHTPRALNHVNSLTHGFGVEKSRLRVLPGLHCLERCQRRSCPRPNPSSDPSSLVPGCGSLPPFIT